MEVVLQRFPSLLGLVKRNIDEHAVLDDSQMFSIQTEGISMKVRSSVKPNLKKDSYALMIILFVKLGEMPATETYILTGAVVVKAAALWNPRLKVFTDKATKDYAVHGGQPADVWFAIMLMLTSAVAELLHNNAINAKKYNKVAYGTKLALLEPMLTHEAKLHSWLKIQPEVLRVGLQAYRDFNVKLVDVIHVFATWFQEAFNDGFSAISVRTLQDELLALRDGGGIPEAFRVGTDDENQTLIPEFDSALFSRTSKSSGTTSGSLYTNAKIEKMRQQIKVEQAKHQRGRR
jgi:hypothetical protein